MVKTYLCDICLKEGKKEIGKKLRIILVEFESKKQKYAKSFYLKNNYCDKHIEVLINELLKL